MEYDGQPQPVPVPPKIPGFLQSAHPLQADIPELPAEHWTTPDFYWNYGWPMSMDEVHAFQRVYMPRHLLWQPNPSPVVAVAGVCTCVKTRSGWYAVRHVFVEPTETVNALSGIATLDGRPGVSFFMLVSTANEYYFRTRPSKEQMAVLKRLFGKEPCWMKDAVEKKLWHEYYDHDV
ncbi:hypothetical protein BD626DRAFT_572505 [Schizophyllum amplum]|uniref:Uncharacterized protein n=1 Tax=Schizophyllum amplum TaxID=97359 RepID=A0A550C4A2_9AGAR|nr:hypothetical protein BD626DRAFT_572505 [Auriculariopsis ampla]